MDNSKDFQLMLDKAIENYLLDFKNFDRTKNVQDQLQEMVEHEKYIDFYLNRLTYFSDETHHNEANEECVCNGRYFTSFEQLWLAFVMKEKFNKVWDGKDWIAAM